MNNVVKDFEYILDEFDNSGLFDHMMDDKHTSLFAYEHLRMALATELIKAQALDNIAEQLKKISEGVSYSANSSAPSIAEGIIMLADAVKRLERVD